MDFDQWDKARSKVRYRALGVGVADGVVYKLTTGLKPMVIGPLAGASAEVTDGTSRHTLMRAVTVVGAFSKKTNAVALVILANGQVVQHKVHGAAGLRAAQAEAVMFNAKAAQAGTVKPEDSPAPAEPPPPPVRHPSDIRRVTAPPPNEFGPEYASKEERIRRFREERRRNTE